MMCYIYWYVELLFYYSVDFILKIWGGVFLILWGVRNRFVLVDVVVVLFNLCLGMWGWYGWVRVLNIYKVRLVYILCVWG